MPARKPVSIALGWIEQNLSEPQRPTQKPVEKTAWRDPEDTRAMERDPVTGRAHRRTIEGWRTIDPLSRLPCDRVHMQAANRLRADWEHGSGATGGQSDLIYKTTNVGKNQPNQCYIETQFKARIRFEETVEQLGDAACIWLLPVVLEGWTVADVVAKRGSGNAMAGQGRVMAALDRLVEVYGLRERVKLDVWEPVAVVDADVTDIPQEQLGRVKR